MAEAIARANGTEDEGSGDTPDVPVESGTLPPEAMKKIMEKIGRG